MGLAGFRDVDAIQLMGEEGRGDALGQSQQRAGIGGRAVEGEQQHRIAAVKQRAACVGENSGSGCASSCNSAQRRKRCRTALGDVGLIFSPPQHTARGSRAAAPFANRRAMALGGLGFHHELRTRPVLLRYAVIIGHGFVHLPHFLIQARPLTRWNISSTEGEPKVKEPSGADRRRRAAPSGGRRCGAGHSYPRCRYRQESFRMRSHSPRRLPRSWSERPLFSRCGAQRQLLQRQHLPSIRPTKNRRRISTSSARGWALSASSRSSAQGRAAHPPGRPRPAGTPTSSATTHSQPAGLPLYRS